MLTVNNVSKSYNNHKTWFMGQSTKVLYPISFHINFGQCMGVVGESGSGKSTLARLMLGLEKPDNGRIIFYPNKIFKKKENSAQTSVQISAVFQDYISSVNPFMSVSEIIIEPITINKQPLANKRKKVKFLLDLVGLPCSVYFKYPHELSGGQLQRLCIARALSINPQFIVLDEPTSSLDMMSQLKILDLLKELKKACQLTYLFISHDIQAVAYLCDEIIFLHQGKVLEQIEVANLRQAKTQYAKKLLSFVV